VWQYGSRVDWGEFVGNLSIQVRTHLGTTHGLFVADFSTTGLPQRIASEIALLDAMEPFFAYELLQVICAIPAIALEGIPGDWERIEARVEGFEQLDPGDGAARRLCWRVPSPRDPRPAAGDRLGRT
jgi:hypothetical protein